MTDPNADIPALVRLSLDGDQQAFARLVESHQHLVFSLAFQRTGHRADAEDIAQETFLRAYRDLRKLREPANFPRWLCHIAINVARETQRRRKPTVPLDAIPEPAAHASPAHDATEERTVALLNALDALPEKYRIPITLHYLRGMSYKAVSLALGVPETTARSLVHRARAMLRERIEKNDDR